MIFSFFTFNEYIKASTKLQYSILKIWQESKHANRSSCKSVHDFGGAYSYQAQATFQGVFLPAGRGEDTGKDCAG